MPDLRFHRVRNYRVKFADGCPQCRHFEDGPKDKNGKPTPPAQCLVAKGLLVVRVKRGDTDECFSVRCQRHVGRFEPTPGQWNDRDTNGEAAA